MQLKIFLKQLLDKMRKDSQIKSLVEKPSVMGLKKYMLFEGSFNKDIKRLYDLDRFPSQPSSLEDLSDEKLWGRLQNLRCFLEAWEDSGLSRKSKKSKKERQAFKYKKDLAKPIRKKIHEALNIAVINLVEAVLTKAVSAEALEEHAKNSGNIAVLTKQLIDAKIANEKVSGSQLKVSGSQLIELTSTCLDTLKAINPDLKSPEGKDIEQRFKKAASAITSFKTLPQKILASLSVSVAVIAALACGFFTGGAIYALIGSALLPGVVIPIVVIAGLIGFAVNGRFFSKSLPEFLLKLTHPSRVTEFINDEGKREQLKGFRKYVYLPLAALFSVAVGVSFAAFSLAQLAAMLVALPFLAATGPLPIILAVVLAITMTIVMFKAFVEIAPKLSFSQLGQSLKTAWKEMSFMKFLSYGITLAVCGMGIFGLFMACYTGFPELLKIFGHAPAIFILVTSFVGQLPFNMLTVSAFCKEMGSFLLGIPAKIKSLFRRAPESSEVAEKPALLSKIAHAGLDFIGWIAMPVLLVINAAANGASLLSGQPSIPKYVAGAAGALNSISGNLVSDSGTQERSQADEKAIQKLKGSLENKVAPEADKISTDSRAETGLSKEASLSYLDLAVLPSKAGLSEKTNPSYLDLADLPFFKDSRTAQQVSISPPQHTLTMVA